MDIKSIKKIGQRVIKHFRNKQKCERKPYLLKTITSHNLEKGIKRGKFAFIPSSLSFFSLYTFFFILFSLLLFLLPSGRSLWSR